MASAQSTVSNSHRTTCVAASWRARSGVSAGWPGPPRRSERWVRIATESVGHVVPAASSTLCHGRRAAGPAARASSGRGGDMPAGWAQLSEGSRHVQRPALGVADHGAGGPAHRGLERGSAEERRIPAAEATRTPRLRAARAPAGAWVGTGPAARDATAAREGAGRPAGRLSRTRPATSSGGPAARRGGGGQVRPHLMRPLPGGGRPGDVETCRPPPGPRPSGLRREPSWRYG